MRVFIAVELPEEIKEKLSKLVGFLKRNISDVKWVEKENFHITIRFIGEVEEDRLLKLEKILEDMKTRFSPFKVEVKGVGNFPHVLWVGIGEGSDTLKNIAYAIEGSLLREGFQPADKLFSPHITLGRVKKNIKKIPTNKEFGPYSFIADSITLMQSQLFPTGPIYTPIKVVRFSEL